MLTRLGLLLPVLLVLPVWSQSGPAAGTDAAGPGGTAMVIVPAVGRGIYPDRMGAEVQSNLIHAGVVFQPAYIDNLYAGSGTTPVSDTTWSIVPNIAIDQSTTRQHRWFSYSPGFTFYQPTSALNEIDENALVGYQYRLTENMDISLHDTFQDSSMPAGTAASFSGGAVSGSPQPFVPGVLAPFAKRLTNSADAEFSLQFAPNDMIGASGTEMKLHFPDSAEVPGLYDSDQEGGSAFYEHRASQNEYLGFAGGYSQVFAYPTGTTSEVQTETYYPFITLYPTPKFSISLAGGDQHFEVSQSSLPTYNAWTPVLMTSIGWQGQRAAFAVAFQRGITAGGGLAGAFHSSTANAFVRFQMSRTWTAEVSGLYAISTNATPAGYFSEPGGHTVSGRAAVNHSFGRQLMAGFEYDRVHQSYGGVAVIAGNPDSDREMVTLAWQFSRPLGK